MSETITISRRHAMAAAKLLEMAADEFGNHGCNDLSDELCSMFDAADAKAFAVLDHVPDDPCDINMDWMAMRYMAAMLRGEVVIPEPSTSPASGSRWYRSMDDQGNVLLRQYPERVWYASHDVRPFPTIMDESQLVDTDGFTRVSDADARAELATWPLTKPATTQAP